MSVFRNAAATLRDDVELWMLPDVATGGDAVRIDDPLEIRLRKGALNQFVLEVKASFESPMCQNVHDSSTAFAHRWANHVFSLYVRGSLVFDGPIEAWGANWSGRMAPGQAHEAPGSTVGLTALNWLPALARRRLVKTATGARWTSTDTPNRLFCQLVREQMVSGAVVTPAISGSGGWQTSGEVRHDFGDIAVACSMPTAAGTSIRWDVDQNVNLFDALRELCNIQTTDADWLWPAESRSGGTVTFSVLRGRSGGSRQIGTDRTTVASGMIGGGPISAERGNLIGYTLEGDRVNKANHVEALGKGRGAGQRRRYKADLTDAAVDGIYEDTTLVPAGGTDEELDHEAQRVVNDRVASQERSGYQVAEIPGAVWPTHFDLADSVPIYTPLGESLTEIVLGVEWTLVAPGPARLKLDLGPWPPIEARDLGRAGGGGRGGRGGGGRARQKSGESETDPDAIKAFLTFNTDDGNTVTADVYNDTCDIGESTTNTPANVFTDGADDPESIGLYFEVDDEDANDEVLVKRALVRTTNSGSMYIRLYQTQQQP